MANPIPPYGVPIHQSIERGDLDEMRKTAGDTEAYVAEVTEALEKLKAEIAKQEGGSKG